jgi:hypothetical protein
VINKSYTNLSWGVTFVVFIGGFFSSIAVTSGDNLGRVNLLYLVLLYVVVPLISLISLALYCVNKHKNSLTDLLMQLPLWPRRWQESLLELKREAIFESWLFCQSQKLMLAFCTGCVSSFLLILLVNDLSFVWRSTLLDAKQVYPVLNAIALPWFFVDSAQPMYQLLVNTQDSRLATSALGGVDYGSWWKFLIMAQLFYGIAPRILLLLWADNRFKQLIKQRVIVEPVITDTPLINRQPAQAPLANVVNKAIHLADFTLVVWADMPTHLLQQITEVTGQPKELFFVGPYGSFQQEQAAIKDPRLKLVIVASWEPPMGELMDFLQLGRGYLMPLDWKNNKFGPVSNLHLDEWRRCCFQLEQWQVLQQENIL